MNNKTTPISKNERNAGSSLSGILIGTLAVIAFFAVLISALVLLFPPARNWFATTLNWLFATDSTQLWWYITRSAGIVAYLLLWLSMVWGLAVPSKIITPVLDQGYTFDFHQFISLLAIGFALLHIIVLTFDRYLPYSTLQILIPFLSPYRPLWVGIGVISFYIIVLVTVTFYLRSRIGMKAFRAIHVFSLLGYLGITLHGLYSGTDSPLLSMQLLYRGTGLVVIFLTIYWLVQKYLHNIELKQKAEAARLPARRPSGLEQRKVH
jgi:predicted ferric reductase